MIHNARTWRAAVGGATGALAAAAVLTGAPAAAQPLPAPPPPVPGTVGQPATTLPGTAGQSHTVPVQPVRAPASAHVPALGAPTGIPLAPVSAPGGVAGVPATAPLGGPGAAGVPTGVPGTAPAGVPRGVPGAAPAAAPTPTLLPAASGTLREYFADKNVALEPQHADGFTALNITVPMPSGWTHVPDPNVPDAFLVMADRLGGDGLYTNNAQLVVYKLVGEFDPVEAITHGYHDRTELMSWQTTGASLREFYGLPSSLIEGTYRENDMTLNTSRRHVIAPSGPDRYLVTLSVTTPVSQSVAAANATDAIINGFRVTPPA